VRLEVGGNSSVGAAMLEQVRARERVRYRPALPGYPRELQDQIDLRRKIPAIKEYRAFTTDLANALHAVERIMDERS